MCIAWYLPDYMKWKDMKRLQCLVANGTGIIYSYTPLNIVGNENKAHLKFSMVTKEMPAQTKSFVKYLLADCNFKNKHWQAPL
jgi:hypothetical protein